MLENLRGMAVFASVVNQGSFSGAARQLGITTSAVSQQIRSLEGDLGVVLLHRSTRKLSLTDAGESYYAAARDVVSAAEQGRIKVNQLRDELSGTLRLATTPELSVNHILPALSEWMTKNEDLTIHFLADNRYVDMIDERVDIAIRMSLTSTDSNLTSYPLTTVRQVLVASPQYLKMHDAINEPQDLAKHRLISIDLIKEPDELLFVHNKTKKQIPVKMPTHIHTNNVFVATTLAKSSAHGLVRVMALDVQKELESGELVMVLPEYQLPDFELYAVTIDKKRQPAKVTRCLEVLEQYFANI